MTQDAYGNELHTGDTVVVTKDLKLKGGSNVVKKGTVVKNIKLGSNNHEIDCKVPGIKNLVLRTEFVKKK